VTLVQYILSQLAFLVQNQRGIVGQPPVLIVLYEGGIGNLGREVLVGCRLSRAIRLGQLLWRRFGCLLLDSNLQ